MRDSFKVVVKENELTGATGYGMQDAGYRMQDAGCRVRDAGCRVEDGSEGLVLALDPELQGGWAGIDTRG